MGLSAHEFAKRQAGAVEIAAEVVRLTWPLPGMTSADSHSLLGRFSCSARVADNPTDRKMFAEVMLRDRSSVTAADLAAQFNDGISTAAVRIARTHSAEEWISGDFRRDMIGSLIAAAKPIAFACGLELLPPEQLDLSSPSFNQQRQTESARVQAEALSAGRLEHLKHAGEMMTKFQEMRQAAPNLPAGVLLDRIAPGDRGAMLHMLLAGSAEQAETQTLWAVAGQNLLRIDLGTAPPRVESIALPATLGPLRSVQAAEIDGERVLLIGARTGVVFFPLSPCSRRGDRGVEGQGEGFEFPPKVAELAEESLCPHPNPSTPRSPGQLAYRARGPESTSTSYIDPIIQSELGFNRAIIWQNHVVGCHGDAGIIGWQIDRPDAPSFRIAPPSNLPMPGSSTLNTAGRVRRPSPRNLETIDEDHAIYSMGGSLKLMQGNPTAGFMPTDLASQNSSEVIAIVPEATSLLIIREDGSIDALDRATRSLTTQLRAGGKICSAAALPWLGSVRLLLANDDGPLDLVGLADSNILRYTSTHRSLRQLAASPQHIAAVSSDRQRLILWKPWESTPFTEIHISAITGHRVADVEFA